MKRLSPRAVPEAFGVLALLVVLGAGCAPSSDVKSGAPVLVKLSILEPSGTKTDMTPGTAACVGFVPGDGGTTDAATTEGGADAATEAAGDAVAIEAGVPEAGVPEAGVPEVGASDAIASEAGASEGGTSDAAASDAAASEGGTAPSSNVKEGDDCDPMVDTVCTLDGAVCHCDAKDMCMHANPSTGGTLHCTFAPQSVVIATFDRILDTAPFTGTDDKPKKAAAAMLSAVPTTTATASGDYRSNGSATGLVFPMFFGFEGPIVTVSGVPAYPTSAKVTTTLDPTLVRAKDGKTGFVGEMALMGGAISFKTGEFALDGITTPVSPAQMMDMGGAAPAAMCPEDMMPMTMNADAGADAAASEGGGDAVATPDVAAEAAVSDASSLDASSADAPMEVEPPSTEVQPDMASGAITITFNNPVDGPAATVPARNVLKHITITEDGKPFLAFTPPKDEAFPTLTVTLKPATMWKAGSTYEVTVDDDTVDVLGAKVAAGSSASFTMSKGN